MVKTGWIIVGGVTAYLLYKSFMAAKAVATFDYSIRSVNFKSSSLLQTELTVTLLINNKTNQPISFTSFIGNAYVKNVPVAAFNIGNNLGITINPGTNPVSFPLIINHINLASEIAKLLQAWQTNDEGALISIKGDLTAAGLTVPINQTLLLNQDAVINGIGFTGAVEMPGFLAHSNY